MSILEFVLMMGGVVWLVIMVICLSIVLMMFKEEDFKRRKRSCWILIGCCIIWPLVLIWAMFKRQK